MNCLFISLNSEFSNISRRISEISVSVHKKVLIKTETFQIRFVSIIKIYFHLEKKYFDLEVKYFHIQLEEIQMGNVLLDYLF